MAKPGRKPTPTGVLKLRGSWRAKLNKNEPEPEDGSPSCPDWLDAEGKRCWKCTVAALEAMGLLSKTDRNKIAGVCQNWALFVKTSKLLNQMEGTESLMAARRLAAINAEAWRNFDRASANFGLDPSSRTRIEVSGDKQKGDKFDTFLKRKNG